MGREKIVWASLFLLALIFWMILAGFFSPQHVTCKHIPKYDWYKDDYSYVCGYNGKYIVYHSDPMVYEIHQEDISSQIGR